MVEPALEWLDRDRNVVGGNDITMGPPVTTGMNTTLTLTFDPLHTSHGGRYTCRGSINISVISFSNSNEADSNVTVQSKSPETINMCEAQTTCCPSLCSQILLLVWFMGELVVDLLDAYTITHPNCFFAYNVIFMLCVPDSEFSSGSKKYYQIALPNYKIKVFLHQIKRYILLRLSFSSPHQ